MQSDSGIHDKHITLNELKRVAAMDADALDDQDIASLNDINQKMKSCETCHNKYLFFLATQSTFHLMKAGETEPMSRVNEILRRRIAEIGTALNVADATLQKKIVHWLDGAQSILGGAFEQQARLRPAMDSAMRGSGGNAGKDARITMNISVENNGFFDFKLSEKSFLDFEVKKETEYGVPICIVVFGRNQTEYSVIYPLESPSPKAQNLMSDRIELGAGEYTICVLTVAPDKPAES